tara:strand:+ start:6137 stop:7246 length:1110 start_codon:yes stop_codon:yes gene_type:complete
MSSETENMATSILKCEYIWIDGTAPTASMRSKTKVIAKTYNAEEGMDITIRDFPIWSFDGSSTQQADSTTSDCVLVPVFACQDPNRPQGILVLCEVLNTDMTTHPSNTRQSLIAAMQSYSDSSPVVGFEQEYFMYSGETPLGWDKGQEPGPQGPYYCAVGANNVSGREVAELHLNACITAGLAIEGINAEVALGQWEYQIGGPRVNAVTACDQLWISRYLLERTAESQGISINWEPKPVEGDWNGSGMHTNFSTATMRGEGGLDSIFKATDMMRDSGGWKSVYGDGLERRLTGSHETCSINEFKAGPEDRTASVRIPWHVVATGSGYLEDRRPNSNADPYLVAAYLINTICQSTTEDSEILKEEGKSDS